jgi:tetratricopeptide (TPR) repeat protein
VERGRLLARAGEAAVRDADFARGIPLTEAAVGLLEPAGHVREAAALKVQIVRWRLNINEHESAREMLDGVMAVLEEGEPDEVLVFAPIVHSRLQGWPADLLPLTDRALRVAESLRARLPLADALVCRAITLSKCGRHEEARALLTHAVGYAQRHELLIFALIARFNLAELSAWAGLLDEAELEIDRTLQHARERGDRYWELLGLEQQAMIWELRGRWDGVVASVPQLVASGPGILSMGATALCERAEVALLRAIVDTHADTDAASLDADFGASLLSYRAALARATGDPAAGLEPARQAFGMSAEQAGTPTLQSLRELRLCSLAAGDREVLEPAVARAEALPAGYSSPMLEAEVALGRAQLALPEEAVAAYIHAVTLHRELDSPFGLAQALLGHGEALLALGDGSAAAPLLEEARELFAALGAARWVERAAREVPAAA